MGDLRTALYQMGLKSCPLRLSKIMSPNMPVRISYSRLRPCGTLETQHTSVFMNEDHQLNMVYQMPALAKYMCHDTSQSTPGRVTSHNLML